MVGVSPPENLFENNVTQCHRDARTLAVTHESLGMEGGSRPFQLETLFKPH